MAKPNDRGTDGDAAVEAAARANALDRYLAARLAPREFRRDLTALAAFMGEMTRIPATASEPLIGEMRLQWWRDALAAAQGGGSSTGSPIVDALRETIARHALPAELFARMLDAHSRVLGADLIPAGPALDKYLDETEGGAFRLSARVLGIPANEAADKLIFAAGQAYGRIQLLRALPLILAARASSRVPLVNDWAARAPAILEDAKNALEEARRHLRDVPAALTAVLPVATVEPYLAALERLGPDIVRARADISPLTRVGRLWWASVRGNI